MNKLEAFEMWVYRRVMRISWIARRTNDEELKITNKDRELLDTIKRRKTAYLGHVIRKERYQFLQLVIEGKGGIGRKKMSWLRNVWQWTGLRTMQELMHTILNKEKCDRKHPLIDTQQKKKKKADIRGWENNKTHEAKLG